MLSPNGEHPPLVLQRALDDVELAIRIWICDRWVSTSFWRRFVHAMLHERAALVHLELADRFHSLGSKAYPHKLVFGDHFLAPLCIHLRHVQRVRKTHSETFHLSLANLTLALLVSVSVLQGAHSDSSVGHISDGVGCHDVRERLFSVHEHNALVRQWIHLTLHGVRKDGTLRSKLHPLLEFLGPFLRLFHELEAVVHDTS